MGQTKAIQERRLTLRATDGAALPAFVAEPAGAQGAPRIVIAPEIFGLSPWIESVARKLAREGFRAIAPEIFVRDTVPLGPDMQSWMARLGRLDLPQSVRDLKTALASLGNMGKAGSIGFCMGGALSMLTAAEGGLSACVSCYGRPRWATKTSAPNPIDVAPRIDCPVLGIYGNRDQTIPVQQAEELRAALPAGSELVLYDAGHAFLNETRTDLYVASQATLAWSRVIGFLRRNLG